MKGNLKGYGWKGEKIAFMILLQDNVIILFSSCYLFKYVMMSEIMSYMYSRIRIFTAICYQSWFCPEFDSLPYY